MEVQLITAVEKDCWTFFRFLVREADASTSQAQADACARVKRIVRLKLTGDPAETKISQVKTPDSA